MKKIIIAAAIILTTGIVSSTNVKPVNTTKTAVAIDKAVLGTAD